ncbi:MAG TPA: FecR domain-containing protein [Turneriella sp.]|nr:FecR domain-containing protein [Turneriella sp.]
MKILFACLFVLAFLSCNKKNLLLKEGSISLVKGNVFTEAKTGKHEKKSTPLHLGDKVHTGETIVTGEASVAILDLGAVQVEIQHNTKFTLEALESNAQVYLQEGSVWTHADKLQPMQKFALRTPNTIAAVRGTKFYTSTDGKTTGTCHCKGKIAFKNNISGYENINDSDYQLFYRDKKAVKVTPDDQRRWGITPTHNHSEIENSPLGKKNTLTAAEIAKIKSYIEKQFNL